MFFQQWLGRLGWSQYGLKKGKQRPKVCGSVELLEDRTLLSVAALLKDINTNTADSDPRDLTVVGAKVFFTANDGVHGRELWVSDGTPVGTLRLTDDGLPENFSEPQALTSVGNTLFFTQYDDAHGRELWKSDGTVAGTVLVKDINAGALSTEFGTLTPVGDTLYFICDDGVHGLELWKTDGTEAGTGIIKDILPGTASGLGNVGSARLVEHQGLLYFTANSSEAGWELWRSDGTEAGTTLALDIVPGPDSPFIRLLVSAGDLLFFTAGNPSLNFGLYRTDGTPGGTVQVANGDVTQMIAVGNRLFFSVGGTALGVPSYLWTSDGSLPGTELLGEFQPLGVHYLTDVGGTVFFAGRDTSHGLELWKSDGTEQGTVRITDIAPGPESAGLEGFQNVNGTLFFAAGPQPFGVLSLWKSNGTVSGTVPVHSVSSHGNSFLDKTTAAIGDTLFYLGGNDQFGGELWMSNGSEAGTALVKDVNTRSLDAFNGFLGSPDFTEAGGTIYFRAYRRYYVEELWATDKTGTWLVTSSQLGGQSPMAFELTELGGAVYFTALVTPSQGATLWKSDGTPTGTVSVLDPAQVPNPQRITKVGNFLFFFSQDQQGNNWLYKSDGTVGGTVRLTSFSIGLDSIRNLQDFGGILFFTTPDGLWRSNGTIAGTVPILSVDIGPTGDAGLVSSGGVLFLSTQSQLWKSDGTSGGTALLRTFPPDGNILSQTLTASGGKVFFTWKGELWVSDGTVGGTKKVNVGNGDVFIQVDLANWNGTLYFFTYQIEAGVILWRTDGTLMGTIPIQTVANVATSPANLTPFMGFLYFTSWSESSGRELWRTNGTTAGTFMVQDIYPGPGKSSDLEHLVVAGEQLFISAIDAAHGREPWVVARLPQVVGPVVINEGAPHRTRVTKIVVPFSEQVTIDPGAFMAVQDNGVMVAPTVSLTVVDSKTVATLTFAGEGITTASLKILADKVRNSRGLNLDGDGDDLAGGDEVIRIRTLDAGLDMTAVEGSLKTLTNPLVGVGGDAAGTIVTINWGDGSSEIGTLIEVGGVFTLSNTHAYTDNGSYTVVLTLPDGLGATITDNLTVIVTNVAPVAVLNGPSDGLTGQARTFTLSASDVSLVDQTAGFNFEINWGDGQTQQVNGAGSASLDHVFQAEGTYTVTITATDKDGGSTSATRTITIVAPKSYLTASLVSLKRKGQRQPWIVVRYADSGVIKSQFKSPFNRRTYRTLAVIAIDTNGDGSTDAVQITAVKVGPRKRKVTRVIPV